MTGLDTEEKEDVYCYRLLYRRYYYLSRTEGEHVIFIANRIVIEEKAIQRQLRHILIQNAFIEIYIY